MNQLTINPAICDKTVSNLLYGIFLEDINFSCDGGLNANMVNNHSFDGEYLSDNVTEKNIHQPETSVTTVIDNFRFWNTKGKVCSCRHQDLSDAGYYAQIHENAILVNNGYGGNRHKNQPCMFIKNDANYELTFYASSECFNGSLYVYCEDKDSVKTTTQATLRFSQSSEWEKYTLILNGIVTAHSRLVLKFMGEGLINVDCITFMDRNYWGAGNSKWSQGKFRKDLIEAIADLRPRFMRFPGGCITEGLTIGNEYHWKKTLGPILQRPSDYNLWGIRCGGNYTQSFQIGFYEYFLLCEDLNMIPIPVVWAGSSCQMRTDKQIPINSDQYQDEVINNVIDLIEYANGDPANNEYAKIRADSGHPAPFGLKYIAFGNENYGDYYYRTFKKVYELLRKKYPYIRLILSSGPFYGSKNHQDAWKFACEEVPDAIVDEHFYNSPRWYFNHRNMYDCYDRNGPKVFAGEYAASGAMGSPKLPNSFRSALAEAAMLTGFERNCDIVLMSSYAPLLSMVHSAQWSHNMINFSPSHVLLTANYYVQKMFMNNIGTYLPKVTTSCSKNICSSVSADEDCVFIKIVNTSSETEAISISVANHSNYRNDIHFETLSGSLTSKNRLTFWGTPEYTVKPLLSKITYDDLSNVEILPYSLTVIKLTKSSHNLSD